MHAEQSKVSLYSNKNNHLRKSDGEEIVLEQDIEHENEDNTQMRIIKGTEPSVEVVPVPSGTQGIFSQNLA